MASVLRRLLVVVWSVGWLSLINIQGKGYLNVLQSRVVHRHLELSMF